MIVAGCLLLLLLMMGVRLVMAVAIVMRRTMPISPTSATTTTTPVVLSGIVGRRRVLVVVLLVMVSVHFLLWHALFRLAPFAVYLVKSFFYCLFHNAVFFECDKTKGLVLSRRLIHRPVNCFDHAELFKVLNNSIVRRLPLTPPTNI